jgi:predicted AAA+ superfamily ATPase
METYIERKLYTEQLKNFINKPVIKVITGIRRCGKSALLELFQNDILKFTDKKHIISINYEDIKYDFITNYKKLDDYITSLIKDKKTHYIFLDEIQDIEHWEKCINSLRLKNTDLYITGSNSTLLSSELSSLLSGRYVEFNLHTLSFSEFINFRKKTGIGSGPAGSFEPDAELEAYIKIGGFPVLSTTSFDLRTAQKIVTDINNSAILKDVIQRNKIRNVQLLQKITAFIYCNTGNITSAKKISDFLKSQRRSADFETVYNYLQYLENALIIHKVPRYDVKGKKLLESYEKYYLAEHSLKYTVQEYSADNISGIMENIVYIELKRRGYTVSIGKINEKEIDFIAEKPGSRLYIQVCYLLANKKTTERELSPLLEVRDSYPKMVVTLDKYWQIENKGIKGIHLKDFLLSAAF